MLASELKRLENSHKNIVQRNARKSQISLLHVENSVPFLNDNPANALHGQTIFLKLHHFHSRTMFLLSLSPHIFGSAASDLILFIYCRIPCILPRAYRGLFTASQIYESKKLLLHMGTRPLVPQETSTKLDVKRIWSGIVARERLDTWFQQTPVRGLKLFDESSGIKILPGPREDIRAAYFMFNHVHFDSWTLTNMSGHSKTTSAFFYGTLMHPKILTRVIGNDGSHLEICPAVLKVIRCRDIACTTLDWSAH